MKKKALKSNRNRHTGRINDYKAQIIAKGKKFVDSKGVGYRSVQSGVKVAMGYAGKVSVPVFSIVRAF